jgi:hypothetical protein
VTLTVGAWAGSWALTNPTTACDVAASAGLSYVIPIANDASAERRETTFKPYDLDRLCRFVEKARARGLEVSHIMAWAMPHARYIESAAETLLPICRSLGVGVEWDAEEPWLKAIKPMNYHDAADLIDSHFGSVETGVNAIVYTSASKVAPLAAVCDYACVQAYVTSTQKLRTKDGGTRLALPEDIPRWSKRFRSKVMRPGQPLVYGLAAYRQKVPPYSAGGLMQACLRAAEGDGAERATFWQLKSFKSKAKARAVAEYAEGC